MGNSKRPGRFMSEVFANLMVALGKEATSQLEPLVFRVYVKLLLRVWIYMFQRFSLRREVLFQTPFSFHLISADILRCFMVYRPGIDRFMLPPNSLPIFAW